MKVKKYDVNPTLLKSWLDLEIDPAAILKYTDFHVEAQEVELDGQ